jgi:Cytochrome c7 and related cytochrome c
MAQIFSPAADNYVRLVLVALVLGAGGLLLAAGGWVRSDYLTRKDIAPAQPVPFSHRHHAGQLGIDCRYCHDSVETAASAGYPPTHTCMTCHSQLWTNADVLAPVRASLATGTPLRWNRVYDLPDYVYFNHGIHVQKGVPCQHCHGPVPDMVRIYRAASLEMSWCLDCHRHPERYLRPPDQVVNFHWQPPADRVAAGRELVAKAGIQPARLDDCYVCHR